MHVVPRKRNKGTVYKVYVQFHGKTKTKTFTRKIDAKNWGMNMETLLKNDSRFHFTFRDLAQEWMENHSKIKKAPASVISDLQQLGCILDIIGNLKIHDINYHHIELLIRELRKNTSRKNKTINRYLTLARTILNYGISKGDLLANPVKKEHFLPEQEVGFRYWQKEEAQKFITYTENKYGPNSQVPLIYKVALNTGLRWGEIAGLKWDAIHFEASHYISVKQSYCSRSHQVRETTKTNKVRFLGMNVVLLEALNQASKFRVPNCDLVFHTNNHTPLSIYNFTKRHFLKDIEEAKVSRIRLHDLRHTYASLYMMEGGNIYDLQKLLGHSDVKITMIYAHLAREYILDKADVLVVGPRKNVISVKNEPKESSRSSLDVRDNVISVDFRKRF